MNLYSVTCDDAVRYEVRARSEDECRSLVRDYEGHDVGFSKWEIVLVGVATEPDERSRVLSFDVLVREPTTKG